MDAPERSAAIAVHPSARAAVEFGPFRFDLADRLLYRGDRQMPLPPRALAVLAHLIERPNQVVTKRALMDAVWKDAFVEESSLKEAISLIRQALDEDAQQPRFIQTMHRRGYRFVAPVSLSPSARPQAAAPAFGAAPPSPRRRFVPSTAVWLACTMTVALVAVGLWAFDRPRPAAARAVRFAIPVPGLTAGTEDGDPRLTISRDGSRIVFVGSPDGVDRLYERSLDRLESREIAGTEHARGPFLSPDGRSIGFFQGGRLMRVAMDGGAPMPVCDIPTKTAGGTWDTDDEIVFGSEDGLFEVRASGGAPSPLTRVDSSRGEIGHWWPHVLPDADSVIFTIWKTGLDRASLAIVSRRRHDQRLVYEGGADARYLPSGELMFARSGGAATVPFDLVSRRVTGPATPLALDAAVDSFDGILHAAVSDDGSLAYIPGSADAPRLRTAWMDRDGTVTPLPLPTRPYRNLRLAPDGRHVAATINEASNYDVWIGDVERGTLTRLTYGGRNIEPVWSPDGQWVLYASSTSRPFTIMRRRADGSGTAEQIPTGSLPAFPFAYTPTGDALMFGTIDPTTGVDIWVLPNQGKAWPFLRSPFEEFGAAFSPDARAVAYTSEESGGDEVYVRPYPGPGGKWQVSTGGGAKPFWSADGRRLFYVKGDSLMAADVRWGASPTMGTTFTVANRHDLEWFGAAPDGRLLALEDESRRAAPSQINVIVNWLEARGRRATGGS